MNQYSEQHEVTVVGIDLGKTWLQVCVVRTPWAECAFRRNADRSN